LGALYDSVTLVATTLLAPLNILADSAAVERCPCRQNPCLMVVLSIVFFVKANSWPLVRGLAVG